MSILFQSEHIVGSSNKDICIQPESAYSAFGLLDFNQKFRLDCQPLGRVQSKRMLASHSLVQGLMAVVKIVFSPICSLIIVESFHL